MYPLRVKGKLKNWSCSTWWSQGEQVIKNLTKVSFAPKIKKGWQSSEYIKMYMNVVKNMSKALLELFYSLCFSFYRCTLTKISDVRVSWENIVRMLIAIVLPRTLLQKLKKNGRNTLKIQHFSNTATWAMIRWNLLLVFSPMTSWLIYIFQIHDTSRNIFSDSRYSCLAVYICGLYKGKCRYE